MPGARLRRWVNIASYMDDGVPPVSMTISGKDYRPSLEWYEILFAVAIAAAAAVMPCIGVINQYKMKKERRQSLNYHFSYRGSSDFKYDVVNDMFINKMVAEKDTKKYGGSGPGSWARKLFASRTTLSGAAVEGCTAAEAEVLTN